MQRNLQFISTSHQRIENGWEHTPSYVNRNIQIHRSSDLQTLQITITPTLGTKKACLEVQTDIFSGATIHQNVSTANILKYIGDDPDYAFYIRNKDSFSLSISPFVPTSKYKNAIEVAFSTDDDLMLVVERRDINVIYKYYK